MDDNKPFIVEDIRGRPRSAEQKLRDAKAGRARNKELNRGETPICRGSSLQTNIIRFTKNGAPAIPTPHQRTTRKNPSALSPASLNRSPYVEDAEDKGDPDYDPEADQGGFESDEEEDGSVHIPKASAAGTPLEEPFRWYDTCQSAHSCLCSKRGPCLGPR